MLEQRLTAAHCMLLQRWKLADCRIDDTLLGEEVSRFASLTEKVFSWDVCEKVADWCKIDLVQNAMFPSRANS